MVGEESSVEKPDVGKFDVVLLLFVLYELERQRIRRLMGSEAQLRALLLL